MCVFVCVDVLVNSKQTSAVDMNTLSYNLMGKVWKKNIPLTTDKYIWCFESQTGFQREILKGYFMYIKKKKYIATKNKCYHINVLLLLLLLLLFLIAWHFRCFNLFNYNSSRHCVFHDILLPGISLIFTGIFQQVSN